uniref:SURP motif domain-containing protein n=1 Tax=Ditylenchus dipsaci TaxID=166011 RepID=A0A915DKX3_9BILA
MTEISKSVSIANLPEAIRDHVEKSGLVLQQPPKEFKFFADPSTINAFDIDLIRLTALFVARNGRQFLTHLMSREAMNYQFDFLKPQHSNFKYFTELVEQYTKVLIPPRDTLEKLRQGNNKQAVLADVRYRVGWERYQRAMLDREFAEQERERLAYSQVDWHDFVVLHTIEFQPSETVGLPPLCSPKDVGTRIVLQQRTEELKHQSDAMEIESGSEEEEAEDDQFRKEDEVKSAVLPESAPRAFKQPFGQLSPPRDKQHSAYQITQPAPAAPLAGNVVIRDYNPKRVKLSGQPVENSYIISPLTNERVPAHKLQEHVQFNTVDPLYREQREREQMHREELVQANASGAEISLNIAKLAERRTDIFGVGAQGAVQTMIGKKLGEDEGPAGGKKI